MSKELLSLTVNEDKATLLNSYSAGARLIEAREAFPEYTLTVQPRDAFFVVCTDDMKVKRWLRI